MKSIQDLKNMQAEKDKLYDELKSKEIDINNKELDIWEQFGKMYEQFDKEEQMVIAGTWVDFIDDLLDYNLNEFMDKNGYDEDDIENTFFVDDENVQKEIFITEEQAKKMLENREKICKEHPYGLVKNMHCFKGIYIEKIEVDILKWFLEIE